MSKVIYFDIKYLKERINNIKKAIYHIFLSSLMKKAADTLACVLILSLIELMVYSLDSTNYIKI